MRRTPFVAVLVLLCLVCCCGDEDRGFDDPDPPLQVDMWPKWSPADTAAIAYTHLAQTYEELHTYGNYSVWVVDVTSGAKRFVVSGVPHDWTPDGEAILFCKDNGVWTVDLETGAETRLLSSTFCGSPRLAPDGSRVTLTKSSGSNYGTWIAPLSSGEATWISPRYASDWSPDGTELICDSLVIIGVDGTWKRKVPHTAAMGYPWHISWCPDGASLAVGGHGPAIYVIGLDGSGEKVVAEPGAVPSWSPDGSKIAYGALSGDGTAMVLWIVNKDGTGKHQITSP